MRAAAPPSDSLLFRPRYAWTVFALTFALMLSDFMTRNVISAVLPALKRDWVLNDSQLGALVSVVPLIVGVAAWPISLLADRWGHVRSVTLMAALWCLATIACGFSQNHTQMLLARVALGLGEAAYGSVGGAILSRVFPTARLSAILGAFSAGGAFGTVLGVAAGGVIAATYGWQAAFIGVGVGSLVLVLMFPLLVREQSPAMHHHGNATATRPIRRLSLVATLREIFAARSAAYTYVGAGLQMLILGVLGAWIPSFLAREYDLPADRAGLQAALIILVAAVGMILGGGIADRTARSRPRRKLEAAAAYTFTSFVLLTVAFALPAGRAQLATLFLGALIAGAHIGVVSAVVINVTHPGLRATALGTLVLFNNLLGLAPGPFIVGLLSDATSLKTALTVVPVAGVLAAVCFLRAAHTYEQDRSASDRHHSTEISRGQDGDEAFR